MQPSLVRRYIVHLLSRPCLTIEQVAEAAAAVVSDSAVAVVDLVVG